MGKSCEVASINVAKRCCTVEALDTVINKITEQCNSLTAIHLAEVDGGSGRCDQWTNPKWTLRRFKCTGAPDQLLLLRIGTKVKNLRQQGRCILLTLMRDYDVRINLSGRYFNLIFVHPSQFLEDLLADVADIASLIRSSRRSSLRNLRKPPSIIIGDWNIDWYNSGCTSKLHLDKREAFITFC